MDRTAVAIRHVAFEDLGSFEPVLRNRGCAISYREAGVDDLTHPAIAAADVLVILGGPIGANDDHLYPFLADEIRLLERRLEAGRPTMGFCLGAQLMARALGARVYSATAKEIGWAPLRLSRAGRCSCLTALEPKSTPVLHWHGDTFDLPDGAEHLASTPICPNQAFSWGPRALALQFHVEATGRGLERWLIGHACEIGATPDVSVPQLRADTARYAPMLEARAQACFETWLDAVAA